MLKSDLKLILRELHLDDVDKYISFIHPSKEYHKYNGPYYKKETELELLKYREELKKELLLGHPVLEDKKMIVDRDNEELIGQVNWYWKSKETNWLEVGIIIFNEEYWGNGIGFITLPLWIDEVFQLFPGIIRIGLTTWSGNRRMMRLAEKLGLKKEAVYRNARIVDGKYYDSVSYGILKDEWYQSGFNSSS